MSISATKCPRVYAGPPLCEKEKVMAADSQTWKAGQPGYFDSNGKAALFATGGTSVAFMFAEDQDTSTASSESVWITKIPSDQTQFVGYVSNGGNDTTAQLTHKGETANLWVASNVATVNVGNDTNVIIDILNPLWEKEAYRNASTDSPGQLIYRYKAASLQG